MLERSVVRRLPVGAEVQEGGGVHFRVWAPQARLVELILDEGAFALSAQRDGYHEGIHAGTGDGTLYRYRVDGRGPFPDPASRFQPEGPHGPSEVVDPGTFAWTDNGWRGPVVRGQVVYELHLGTFTPEGTWEAASHKLPELRDLGVTTVEVMPVADFHGRFGWGYDGVNLFAPTRLYGRPEDFRRFVDQAHALGLSVLLDVVYNHLGPEGNYLSQFANEYFAEHGKTEWGQAINYDGPGSAPVREFFISNVVHWVSEYHLDGLRFDATHAMHDRSDEHILAAMQKAARGAAGTRALYLVAENESQESRLVRPVAEGGFGFDAVWNDDFHHSACVALTGRREAYYADYLGRPQELVSALRWAFLYQGQRYEWQKKCRGTPALDLPATAFVHYLENHDQVANSAQGLRLGALSHPGDLRAMTAVLLLGPQTPMLFQGQEYGSTRPFLYFADMPGELGHQVSAGRREFLRQFQSLSGPEAQAALPDAQDPSIFERSKLDASERHDRREMYRLHRDLLALRRSDPAFASQRSDRLHGAVIAERAFALRWVHPDVDRLLIVNLGEDLDFVHMPEPLLAPPSGAKWWRVLWSSDHPAYGGPGFQPPSPDGRMRLSAHSATVLAAAPAQESA